MNTLDVNTLAADPAGLRNKTLSYLDTFNKHEFRAVLLKNKVKLSTEPASLLGPDTGGFTVDPHNKEKVAQDILATKSMVSTLKFAHLELQGKLGCVERITNPQGTEFATRDDNDAAEARRAHSKAELKRVKQQVAQVEIAMRLEADNLEQHLELRHAEAQLTAQLLADCDAMEIEIANLQSKRSHADRVTLDEGGQICDEQCEQMATLGTQSDQAQSAIQETKSIIASRKRAVEKLGATKHNLMREEAGRAAKGAQDARAEEGCRWITHSTAFFSALQGIKSITTIGTPATEMRLVYDIGADGKEDERTLSIELGEDGRMTGAKLLDSAIRIDDLVKHYLNNQDLRMLVQEVRTRVGR